MKFVLVACEESQEVCKAFRALGAAAFSCDLQPCSGGHPEWHILGDAFRLLNGGLFSTLDGRDHYVSSWDLLIAHPPCTFLSNAGARHLYKGGLLNDERYQKGLRAAQDFFGFYTSPVPHVCVENPVPSLVFGLPRYSQIIQPWQFGHPFTKRTCFWLRGLPQLVPTCVVQPIASFCPSGSYSRAHEERYRGIFTKDRAKNRSKTFSGVAAAMAAQWLPLL